MRARLPILAVICGLVAAIAACSDRSPTASAGTLELTVSSDRSVYSLATDRGAVPILINRGSVRVYLPMNEYVAVQRFELGHGQSLVPGLPLMASGSVLLSSRATRCGRLRCISDFSPAR